MNIYEKLLKIQNELKAPKNQFNKFGNYKYRNAEDILEAVKPICAKYKTVIILGDKIELVGDRYYVKAVARLNDCENTDNYTENCAYAREELTKKGMDAPQITGATSSYARKYALNGLLNIDDTKDTDSEEYQKKSQNANKPINTNKNQTNEILIQDTQKELIKKQFTDEEIKSYLVEVKKPSLGKLTVVEASNLLKRKAEK